jgi:hypothetical protein
VWFCEKKLKLESDKIREQKKKTPKNATSTFPVGIRDSQATSPTISHWHQNRIVNNDNDNQLPTKTCLL